MSTTRQSATRSSTPGPTSTRSSITRSAGTALAGPATTIRLRGRLDDLQPTLRRIAERVLQDPRAASGMTIGDLARAAKCSEATVVRLANEVGYSGYREFRLRLAEETAIANVRAEDTQYAGDIDADDDLETVVGKIATADTRAVQDTASALDLETLRAVSAAIGDARRIALIGVGASGLAAQDLHHKLARVGLASSAHTDVHDALPAAALLHPGDVAVGFSHSGRTADVVDALRVARDSGATTVAVTDAPASPIARLAAHTLLTAAHESAFRSGATASRIAQLTVVDCMFVAVAQRLPDLGRDALARTRTAIDDRRLP